MAVRIVDQEAVQALLDEDKIPGIIEQIVDDDSSVLSLMTRLRDMTQDEQVLTIANELPHVEWVDGVASRDNPGQGMKPLSSASWANKKIHRAELATIVPIPIKSLKQAQRAGRDPFVSIQRDIVQYSYAHILNAMLFGNPRPATWRTSVYETAVAMNKIVPIGSDLYASIMGVDGVIAKVEEDGFFPDAILSGVKIRSKLRDLRGTDGHPIFKSSMQTGSSYELESMPMHFVRSQIGARKGAWEEEQASLIVGDWSQIMYSIADDFQWDVLTEATLIDTQTREIVFALAQQNMVALRVSMAMGWEMPLADPDHNILPFAVLTANGGVPTP